VTAHQHPRPPRHPGHELADHDRLPSPTAARRRAGLVGALALDVLPVVVVVVVLVCGRRRRLPTILGLGAGLVLGELGAPCPHPRRVVLTGRVVDPLLGRSVAPQLGVAVVTAEKPTDMGRTHLISGSVLAAPGGVRGGGVPGEGFGAGAGVALKGSHRGVSGASEQHRGVGAGLGVVGQRGVP